MHSIRRTPRAFDILLIMALVALAMDAGFALNAQAEGPSDRRAGGSPPIVAPAVPEVPRSLESLPPEDTTMRVLLPLVRAAQEAAPQGAENEPRHAASTPPLGVSLQPPGLPAGFWGTVRLNGRNIAEGTPVTAWVDGVQVAQTNAIIINGASMYNLDVPADASDTPRLDGGYNDAKVRFMIGTVWADPFAYWQSGEVTQFPIDHRDKRPKGDFDGDSKMDLAIWRPGKGKWYILYSSTRFDYYQAANYHLGTEGDVPISGDVDGDGKADLIVWRNGRWMVAYSSQGYGNRAAFGWGKSEDVPLGGDFDGDSKMDLVVWRPSKGRWYILYSAREYDYYQAASYSWGQAGDIPISGDVDGDGKADLIVWRNGRWMVAYSSQGYGNRAAFGWGKSGDVPLGGDADGDGKMDLIIWRPSNGRWYILYSSKNYDYHQAASYSWGRSGDIPVAGDADGDGKMDLIVWRNGCWIVAYSLQGYGNAEAFGWGTTGDLPLPK